MFSFLNFLNQGLNYFNFFNLGQKGNQILNRIYLILSILGDAYLFYVADRFIKNQYLIHGGLILVAAVALVYLIYVNVWYYFFNRTAPFDVSPLISRKLGIRWRTSQAVVSPINEVQNLSSGDREHRGIPVTLWTNGLAQRNLVRIIRDLSWRRQIFTNYAGLNPEQINELLHRNGNRPVYSIGRGVELHWFRVVRRGLDLELYAGTDRDRQFPVGQIRRIGFSSVDSLRRRRQLDDLSVSSVVLTGGPYQVARRSGVHEFSGRYRLLVKVSRIS